MDVDGLERIPLWPSVSDTIARGAAWALTAAPDTARLSAMGTKGHHA